MEGHRTGCTLEVSFSPKLYSSYASDDAIVVVIDILRASSAICTAFQHGAKSLIPVSSIEEAREYQEKGYLVGAERGGEVVEGFDFGNSPYSYMGDEIKGNTIVLTTTNGTKAINIARNAHCVAVGAFTNITALCDWLKEEKRDVLLLCAGWRDRYNLEDALFAGAVVNELARDHEWFPELGDSALASKYLYLNAKDDPYKFLRNSSHRSRLALLNLKEDIKYCLTLDQTTCVPILQGDRLVELSSTLVSAVATKV